MRRKKGGHINRTKKVVKTPQALIRQFLLQKGYKILDERIVISRVRVYNIFSDKFSYRNYRKWFIKIDKQPKELWNNRCLLRVLMILAMFLPKRGKEYISTDVLRQQTYRNLYSKGDKIYLEGTPPKVVAELRRVSPEVSTPIESLVIKGLLNFWEIVIFTGPKNQGGGVR